MTFSNFVKWCQEHSIPASKSFHVHRTVLVKLFVLTRRRAHIQSQSQEILHVDRPIVHQPPTAKSILRISYRDSNHYLPSSFRGPVHSLRAWLGRREEEEEEEEEMVHLRLCMLCVLWKSGLGWLCPPSEGCSWFGKILGNVFRCEPSIFMLESVSQRITTSRPDRYSGDDEENRYVECLPILYANEFRFSKQRELCITFPNQVPAAGLASVRRITLWWTLGNDLQLHISLQNKANYDLLWSAPV